MARVVIFSDKYDELRAQAAALLTRVNTQEELIAYWQRLANSLTKRLAMVDYDAISAVRETNALLTARVEELERQWECHTDPHGKYIYRSDNDEDAR